LTIFENSNSISKEPLRKGTFLHQTQVIVFSFDATSFQICN